MTTTCGARTVVGDLCTRSIGLDLLTGRCYAHGGGIKKRRCRGCREVFKPRHRNQQACSLRCRVYVFKAEKVPLMVKARREMTKRRIQREIAGLSRVDLWQKAYRRGYERGRYRSTHPQPGVA